jgi:hypothetical protein
VGLSTAPSAQQSAKKKKSLWTEEEGELLSQLQAEMGNKWKRMGDSFDGRSSFGTRK